MARRSLLEYLEGFDRHASQTVYIHRRGYRTERWSYRRVAETAGQFARELEARGIGKGDRILIWGDNCAEWAVAFWGCLLREAVAVPMDRAASPDFAGRVAAQVGAKLLAGSRELPPLDPGPPKISFEALAETVAHHSKVLELPPGAKREDAAEIIFTSGTTAEPKGVVLTHGNFLANLEPLETHIQPYLKYERFVHPLRFLDLVPLSHIFGQFVGLFVPPLLAGQVIFENTLNPSEILRTVRTERVWVLVSVPRLLESLRDKIERDLEAEGRTAWFREQYRAAEGQPFLRRWWRFRRLHRKLGWRFLALLSGGATLDAETEGFFQRLGFAVIQGYGLTETTSMVSVRHPFRAGKGSIGQVLAGREVRLAEDGEILVRGESVASSYWQGSAMTPVQAKGEWFHTGDLGELDESGNLYFKGRKKNVLVTPAGMNVYPEDLEAALRRQPEVRDCVVLGVARGGNEEPCAVLILDPGVSGAPREEAAKAAVDRANQSLAEYQQIRQWRIWPAEDFPRTTTQKPKVNAIREVLTAEPGQPGQAAAVAGGSPLAELIGRVRRQGPAPLSAGVRLDADLNLSSIDRVELMSAIEDRYQIDLNESGFSAAKTVGELEQLLREPPAPCAPYPFARWAQRGAVRSVRTLVYYLLVWPATAILAYPRVKGRENLRGVKGPALVIANHVTEIDAGFVLAALPFRLRHWLAVAMVGERLRTMRYPPGERPLLGRVLDRIGYALVVALFNVFPLPKESGFRESFQFAGESADRGFSVLVFPEGQLTRDGRVGAFRAGVGVLANKLSIPIVPMRIDGLFELRQAGKRMARPGAIRVTVGAPVRFEPGTEPEQIAKQLEEKVKALGGGQEQ